jgi:hypothetical protein
VTKLVCRLLDADGKMLGWCAHEARLSGDGFLRASSQVVMHIEESGDPTVVSIHWADVNVETRVPIPPTHVSKSMALTLFQPNAPMLQAGEPPKQRLPPVTMRTVEVSVPVGSLGALSVA